MVSSEPLVCAFHLPSILGLGRSPSYRLYSFHTTPSSGRYHYFSQVKKASFGLRAYISGNCLLRVPNAFSPNVRISPGSVFMASLRRGLCSRTNTVRLICQKYPPALGKLSPKLYTISRCRSQSRRLCRWSPTTPSKPAL